MSIQEKILIVEDNISQSNLISSTLAKHFPDWIILSAHSLSEAEKILTTASSKYPITLFLLDVQLTGDKGDRGGFVLANEIRSNKLYYRTPILFLTAVTDEAIYALSNFHCYNYIPKPYSPDDLVNQIKQMQLTGYISDLITITDTTRITRKINPDDIYRIDITFHVLNLYLSSGVIHTREYSMETIMSILPAYFKRCHKKHIVNTHLLEDSDLTRMCLTVKSTYIPVSNTYIDIFNQIGVHE